MRRCKKLATIALSAGIAIGVSGVCSTPLFAQDTSKPSKRAEQTARKKAHAKQPTAARARDANTGAATAPYSQPATSFPVNGY